MLGSDRHCYMCGETFGLERHHIYHGNPGRKISEANGFVVMLCPDCHRNGKQAVHRNRESDLKLKRTMQEEYEKTHTREEFMRLIGRNYSD